MELMRETMCDTVLGGGAGGGRDARSRSRGGLQVQPPPHCQERPPEDHPTGSGGNLMPCCIPPAAQGGIVLPNLGGLGVQGLRAYMGTLSQRLRSLEHRGFNKSHIG